MAFPKFTNEGYFKSLVLFLLFLLLAFDRDMSMIYLLILIGDYIWYRFDRNIVFPLEKTKSNRFSALIEAGIATAGFFIISSAVIAFAAVDITPSFQSIVSLLATATPVLKGNKILTLIGWGVIIPIIETSFFNGRLLEGIATYAEKRTGKKINFNKITTTLIVVVLVIAAFFTLFHLTAKNLASAPLMITFVFSVISSILVIKNKELKQAIILHIITNSLAVLSSFGLLQFF